MSTTSVLEQPMLGELEAELEAIGAAGNLTALRHAAMMEHLAAMAADSESEAEAEAFIGALAPMAASLVPKIAPRVAAAVPAMAKGASQIARRLWSSPTTRQMVRAVPTIMRRSMADVAARHASGRPIRTVDVTRALARHTVPVLRAPDQRRRALQVNAAARRAVPVRQISRPPTAPPTAAYRPGAYRTRPGYQPRYWAYSQRPHRRPAMAGYPTGPVASPRDWDEPYWPPEDTGGGSAWTPCPCCGR